MSKIKEIHLTISGQAFDELEDGLRNEVYCSLTKRWTKRFITLDGRAALLIDSKRENNFINAVLAAWDIGYKVPYNRVVLRRAVSDTFATYRIKSILIREPRPAWVDEERRHRLSYVIVVGDRIQ